MATVKINNPQELTGNTKIDIQNLYAHQRYLANQLNYVLNNLDEENIISAGQEE